MSAGIFSKPLRSVFAGCNGLLPRVAQRTPPPFLSNSPVPAEPRARPQKGSCKGQVIGAKMISLVKKRFRTFAEFSPRRKTTRQDRPALRLRQPIASDQLGR